MPKNMDAKITRALRDDHGLKKAADAMDGEVSIELTDEQREALMKFIDANEKFPTVIEVNFKAPVTRNAAFPVTVLVGAMT